MFHTLEADDDGFLALDGENRERIAAAIAERDANIFVYDPLRDFGTEDLNGDKNMTDALREIARLTRRGNPRRVPLNIHHAGTGRAGTQKATGFGRNFKVLFGWVRAQINVAPARPDDKSLPVVASGKCSNAVEFEPFAVRLDPETMLYERDADFDFDAWRESLESPESNTVKLTLVMVPALLPEIGSMPKNRVIEKLRDQGGEKKARTFLAEQTTATGPIHEWKIKRSSIRDEIQLSRVPQASV